MPIKYINLVLGDILTFRNVDYTVHAPGLFELRYHKTIVTLIDVSLIGVSLEAPEHCLIAVGGGLQYYKI